MAKASTSGSDTPLSSNSNSREDSNTDGNKGRSGDGGPTGEHRSAAGRGSGSGKGAALEGDGAASPPVQAGEPASGPQQQPAVADARAGRDAATGVIQTGTNQPAADKLAVAAAAGYGVTAAAGNAVAYGGGGGAAVEDDGALETGAAGLDTATTADASSLASLFTSTVRMCVCVWAWRVAWRGVVRCGVMWRGVAWAGGERVSGRAADRCGMASRGREYGKVRWGCWCRLRGHQRCTSGRVYIGPTNP